MRRFLSRQQLIAGLGLACVCGLSAPAQAAFIDNLELYHNFNSDSTAAGGINDVSPNGRNGSGVDVDGGGVSYGFSNDVASAGLGQSLNLSGTTDYVISDTPGYNGITGTGDRTVAAWLKLDNVGTSITIMEWGTDSAGQRWAFRVNRPGTNGTVGGLRVEVASDFVVGNDNVADGEWHHVAATFTNDGSPVVEDVQLYVDGVLQSISGNGGNSPSINTSGANQVTIGSSQFFTDDRSLPGLLDEVAVWSRVLSDEEIRTLASGSAVIPSPTAALFGVIGLGALAARRRRI